MFLSQVLEVLKDSSEVKRAYEVDGLGLIYGVAMDLYLEDAQSVE